MDVLYLNCRQTEDLWQTKRKNVRIPLVCVPQLKEANIAVLLAKMPETRLKFRAIADMQDVNCLSNVLVLQCST